MLWGMLRDASPRAGALRDNAYTRKYLYLSPGYNRVDMGQNRGGSCDNSYVLVSGGMVIFSMHKIIEETK